MPFEIVRNDISHMRVDAVVNPANSRPVIGYGADAGIHGQAGPQLLEARKKIGRIQVGDAAITPGFGLDARYVIHAVGPAWRGGLLGEEKLLRKCYDSALKLALEHGCSSVAFPLLSAGNRGFPKERALRIAMNAISDFLMEHEMRIILVVFGNDVFQLSERLFHDVASYIDENYVFARNLTQYGVEASCTTPKPQSALLLKERMAHRRYENDTQILAEESFSVEDALPRPAAMPAPAPSLKELLNQADAGFSETLLKLIDRTGKKDSEIYTRANVSRQHFSKIRNNPGYKPTKATAIAFAIALELDLDQTRDLIGRAGYALTRSSKFDLIIMYFIGQRNYDLFEINAALFEFDQALLGA